MGTQSTWGGRASFLVKPTFDPPSANMLIYKDIFSGDELFSDTYKITLVKGCVYEVVGKWETRKGDDVQLEGANASAEEAAEGTENLNNGYRHCPQPQTHRDRFRQEGRVCH